MPRIDAHINPEVLRWARARAGLSLSEAADRLTDGDADKLASWESGASRPTMPQATKAARQLHVPFGYLFFAEPPSETEVLPDLRTVGDHASKPSPELRDVVRDARRRQEWSHDFRRAERMDPVPLVGSCRGKTDAQSIARSLREHLGADESVRAEARNWEDYMRRLVSLAEAAGVLVYRSSYVGNNTRQAIDVADFRGFAMTDEHAPLIFINTADAPPARIFTLVHELAHLALGISGVSNVPVAAPVAAPERPEEKLCNAIAAEFLVPRDAFLRAWDHDLSLSKNASTLARHFRVSQLVIGRRALELGLAKRGVFWKFARARLDLVAARKSKQREKETKLSPKTLVPARNGRQFTETVVLAARSGRLLYRDAAALLGVTPGVIDRLAEAG